jgi:NADH-quinone oxidoreductase subunit N
VLFYLAGYVATNLAAFSVIIAISNKINSDRIDDFAGMRTRAPYLAAVLALAMISLTGVPPTVGFMAKVYIFGAAVNANLEWLALAGVINSVVSAYYYLRVLKVMYLNQSENAEPVRAGFPIHLAATTTVATVLFFGIYPTPLIQLAATAVQILPS